MATPEEQRTPNLTGIADAQTTVGAVNGGVKPSVAPAVGQIQRDVAKGVADASVTIDRDAATKRIETQATAYTAAVQASATQSNTLQSATTSILSSLATAGTFGDRMFAKIASFVDSFMGMVDAIKGGTFLDWARNTAAAARNPSGVSLEAAGRLAPSAFDGTAPRITPDFSAGATGARATQHIGGQAPAARGTLDASTGEVNISGGLREQFILAPVTNLGDMPAMEVKPAAPRAVLPAPQLVPQ
ncbi:MAG: hypothetical protein V4621_03995 [Pseudomonadota bacterium]